MINKRQKEIAVALIVFIILASIAVTQNYQASANVGLMSNAEQFSIINIRFIEGNKVKADQIKITLQNTGYNSVTITNGYLNGTQATSISPQPAVINEGYSAFVTLAFEPHTFVDGSQYEIKLLSIRGTSTVYNKKFDAAYNTQHNFDEPLPARLPTRAQIETENRISLTIIASIIIAFVVTSGLFFYSKFIYKRKRVYKSQEQTVYIDRIGQALSSLSIGFGFVFFCFSILLGLMSIGSLIISITPLILAATLILKERSKKLFSVRKIAIGFILGVLGYLFLRFIPGFQILLFLLGSPDFLTILLVGCGFFSIGLMGIYIDKKAESLTLLFLVLALLFFSFVPVAAMYKEVEYFEFDVPISQRYPIQLSLAGLAFLLWGILSKLFARFYPSRALPSILRADEITKPELDRTLNLGDKSTFNRIKLIGFLLLIIAPIGFMGAAYIYQPPYISLDIFFGTRTSFAEFSSLMVSVSIGLFIFGGVSTINQKSKLLMSFVAAGSLVLVAATLAYVYQAPITSLTFGYFPTIDYSTIYRVYAIPLFITSAVFYAFGIILMLKAHRPNNYQGIFEPN
jgi:hypothetical protein